MVDTAPTIERPQLTTYDRVQLYLLRHPHIHVRPVNIPSNWVFCYNCGLSWKPRVDNPRACPGCKDYSWNQSYWETENEDESIRHVNKEGRKNEHLSSSVSSELLLKKARKLKRIKV